MKTTYLYIIIAILLLLLITSVNKCSENKNYAASATQQLTAQETYFKNKLGTITASKNVLETSEKNLKNIILKQDDSLKKLADEFHQLKSITRLTTEIKIKEIEVPFKIEIPCAFERKGTFQEKHFSFDYMANSNGFIFENFEIQNKQTIITGFKRKWFLGRQTLTTDVTNSNPLLVTTEVNTIEVAVPKKFYDTRAFNIGVGLLSGYLLAK